MLLYVDVITACDFLGFILHSSKSHVLGGVNVLGGGSRPAAGYASCWKARSNLSVTSIPAFRAGAIRSRQPSFA